MTQPRPHMPKSAPLEMHTQSFRQRPSQIVSPPSHGKRSLGWRLAVFVPALIGTALLVHALYGWLAETGMTGLEWALLSMIGMTFVWVSLSVSTVGVAVAGLLARTRIDRASTVGCDQMNVALLVPVYNENTSDVFGNAAAMLDDLHRRPLG